MFNLSYWLKNVFKIKTHKLSAGKHIRLGQWADFDYRLLYCNFNSFEEYIEKEFGLDKLEEAISQDGKMWSDLYPNFEGYDCLIRPQGVEEYKEAKELYLWWKKRKVYDGDDDPYEEDTEMLVRLMKARRALWS